MDKTKDSKAPIPSREKGERFREYYVDLRKPDYAVAIDQMSNNIQGSFAKIGSILRRRGITVYSTPPDRELQRIDNCKIYWELTDKQNGIDGVEIPLSGGEYDMYRERLSSDEYLRIVKLSNILIDFMAIEVALRNYFLKKFKEEQIQYNARYLLRPSDIVQKIMFLYLDGKESEANNFLDSLLNISDLDELPEILKKVALSPDKLVHKFSKRIPDERKSRYYFHSTRADIDDLSEGIGGNGRPVKFNAGLEWDVNDQYVVGHYNNELLRPHTTIQVEYGLVALYAYLFGYSSEDWGGEQEVSIEVPKNLRIPWKDLAVRISEYKK